MQIRIFTLVTMIFAFSAFAQNAKLATRVSAPPYKITYVMEVQKYCIGAVAQKIASQVKNVPTNFSAWQINVDSWWSVNDRQRILFQANAKALSLDKSEADYPESATFSLDIDNNGTLKFSFNKNYVPTKWELASDKQMMPVLAYNEFDRTKTYDHLGNWTPEQDFVAGVFLVLPDTPLRPEIVLRNENGHMSDVKVNPEAYAICLENKLHVKEVEQATSPTGDRSL